MRCFYYTVVAHLRRASHHALRRRHGIMQTVDSRQRCLFYIVDVHHGVWWWRISER
uniref:hypothetical protein n=1 Tax=Candidatus Limisoma sp. TaxID=3076476 RepID=UPI004029984C